MMTFRRIANYVGAEPFHPFRIKMTSGETFEIRHPEMISIGRTTAHVFTWMDESNENPKESEKEISIILIESIEPLKHSNAQNGTTNPS